MSTRKKSRSPMVLGIAVFAILLAGLAAIFIVGKGSLDLRNQASGGSGKCLREGTRCGSSAYCCTGLTCSVNSKGVAVCQTPKVMPSAQPGNTCGQQGQPCAMGSTTCCSGLNCVVPPGGSPTGATCQAQQPPQSCWQDLCPQNLPPGTPGCCNTSQRCFSGRCLNPANYCPPPEPQCPAGTRPTCNNREWRCVPNF